MKKEIFIFFILMLLIPCVLAKDMTFSLDQKEYYFKVGENAVIPLSISNNYGKQINGQFTYTYTQETNQGGMQMSSSNTQTNSFSIKDGESTVSLNFGTSSSPVDIKASLSFLYSDSDKQKAINLDEIIIHFVNEDSKKNNQPNKVSSSSKTVNNQNQGQNKNQEQNSLAQQAQQMMNQIMGNSGQNNPGTLQNNQMDQDTSALKQQMQEQMQENNQMKKDFANALDQNKEFQQSNNDLSNKGYKIDSANLNPQTNDSGNFEVNYKNDRNESANIAGEMENGQMKTIKTETSEDKQRMLDMLNQNKDFKNFKNQLQKQGFNQTNTDISNDLINNSITNIVTKFQNEKNESAQISAKIINGTVQKVKLSKDSNDQSVYYHWLAYMVLLLVIITTAAYFIYKRYFPKKEESLIIPQIKEEISFDYVSESLKLIEESKILFKEGKFKDSYSKVNQSVRLYLSYKNDLKKELTNDEIIAFFKNKIKNIDNPLNKFTSKRGFSIYPAPMEGNSIKGIEYIEEMKEFFDLCSLVEFAKYKANKTDFDKIINYAEKVIK